MRTPLNPSEYPQLNKLLDSLSENHFDEWYREHQYRQNIENGTPYFNEAGFVPSPERHSPSTLLQCHRKLVYRQCNAPAERAEPEGLYWFGTQFETEIGVPFLRRAVAGPNTYVRNSDWLRYTVETSEGPLEIRGTTDPVIVDSESIPILPTEIKTRQSLDHLSSPLRHHPAQLHAYMVGLSEKYEVDLTTGIIIYGGRESLSVKIFEVEFDPAFWNDVVIEWASAHTRYRLQDELPQDRPEFNWECKFCSYRERCGKGTTPYNDLGVTGLLPNFTDYPREQVIEYLEANPEGTLTPTLADRYPDLAEAYEVADWECHECGCEIGWDSVASTKEPLCPRCAEAGQLVSLKSPAQQNGERRE